MHSYQLTLMSGADQEICYTCYISRKAAKLKQRIVGGRAAVFYWFYAKFSALQRAQNAL